MLDQQVATTDRAPTDRDGTPTSGRGRYALGWALLAIPLVVIGYLALSPLIYLMWGTFGIDGGFTLRPFGEAFDSPGIGRVVVNTLLYTIGCSVLTIALGATLAYLVARTDVRFKRLIYAASLLPLMVPSVLYTLSWILLGSPRTGLFNEILDGLFGIRPFDIFTVWGMVWASSLHHVPLVFLLLVAAFRSVDPSLEETSLTSGSSYLNMLRRVTLPTVRPALFGSFLLVAVTALGDFPTPALLGNAGGIQVLTTRVYYSMHRVPADYAVAGALSIIVFALATVGIYLYSRVTRREKAFQTITGKGFRPRVIELSRAARWWANAFVLAYFILAVVLPVLILANASTQPRFSAPALSNFANATINPYIDVLNDQRVVQATWNTLLLAVGTATITILLTTIAAWFVVKRRIRGRWLIDNLTFLPLTIPGVIIGVSFIFIYLRSPVPVYGTLWILLLAYVTRTLPYGMRNVATSMHQISNELVESAQTSGAGLPQTLRRVILPLLAPGMVAGWIFIAMMCIRELDTSILLYVPGTEVLSVVVWNYWQSGFISKLAALGMLMMAGMLILAVIAQRLGARAGIRGDL